MCRASALSRLEECASKISCTGRSFFLQATVRKKRSPRNRKQNKRVLEQINHNAAGADMGSETVWICVGEHLSEEPVRVFGTTTAQLRASAEWMRSLGVDTVA